MPKNTKVTVVEENHVTTAHKLVHDGGEGSVHLLARILALEEKVFGTTQETPQAPVIKESDEN